MVNDMGVDPNEWFETEPKEEETTEHITDEYAPCDVEYDYENNWYDPDGHIEDDWFTEKPKEEEKTMHQKMYEIATARYNPFSLGGSENCDSDVSCNTLGGSEQVQNK